MQSAYLKYNQTFHISRTLTANKIVDHSDILEHRLSVLLPLHLHSRLNTSGPFYWHGLTLIQAWISNYMSGKVWGEITYPFLKFNSCTVEV